MPALVASHILELPGGAHRVFLQAKSYTNEKLIKVILLYYVYV